MVITKDDGYTEKQLKMKVYWKIYYQKNKEKIKQRAKANYLKNRNVRIQQMKNYNDFHKNMNEEQKKVFEKKQKIDNEIKVLSKSIILHFE